MPCYPQRYHVAAVKEGNVLTAEHDGWGALVGTMLGKMSE